MTFEGYKEIITNGERVDWYGVTVPRDLITMRVRVMSQTIEDSLNKLESDIEELRKGSKERVSKQGYIDVLLNNIRNLPYTNNGKIDDFYMLKRKRIEKEIEENKPKVKPKTTRTRKPKETVKKPEPEKVLDEEPKVDIPKKEEKPEVVIKSRRGKKNSLIFGK
jgi:hypothetical protein